MSDGPLSNVELGKLAGGYAARIWAGLFTVAALLALPFFGVKALLLGGLLALILYHAKPAH